MEKIDAENIQNIALFTSLIFAVHPVNVESVTWLSGRKYVLLSFFSFFSFFLYVVNSKRQKFSYSLSLACLITALLAVFSSPFGVIMPALFFLYEYCRDGSNNPLIVFKKRIKNFLPYLVFVLIVFPKLWSVLLPGASKAHYKDNVFHTLWSILKVLFDYFRNLAVPIWLNSRYPDYSRFQFSDPKIITAIFGLLFLLVVIVRQMRHADKTLLFCSGWFFISWVPASNIIPISTKMADRYIYVASVGVFLYIVLILLKKIHSPKKNIIICAFSICLIVYSGLSIQRNNVWKNSISLWKDSLKKDPNNVLPLINIGAAYFEKKQNKQAIKYTYAATVLFPDHHAVQWKFGCNVF